jgi:hypothetical protein
MLTGMIGRRAICDAVYLNHLLARTPNGDLGPKADRQLSSEKAEKRTFNG